MGKLVVECEEKLVDLKKLSKVLYKKLKQKGKLKVELSFVTEDEIQILNKEQRNIDKVTDVLSFPTLDNIKGKILDKKDFPFDTEKGYILIGSIVICTKRAKEQAEEYGHSQNREITYLTLHGLLHLMGYDHMEEVDKVEMRTIEKEVIKEMNLEVNQ